MAIVTRRYRREGPRKLDLDRFVDPSAVVNRATARVVDIDIDDDVAGFDENLDSYMDSLGFVHDESAILPQRALCRVAANGTLSNAENVDSVTKNGTGDYTIELSETIVAGGRHIDITPIGTSPAIPVYDTASSDGDSVRILLFDTSGVAVDSAFRFKASTR